MKPYYEHNGITIYNGDCREILPTLDKVDLVLTDPPYGIGANKQTLGKGKKEFHRGGDWDKSAPVGIIETLLKLDCDKIIWGGNYFTSILPPTNDWLIWHKKNDGRSFSECEMAWTNLGKQTRMLSHHWGGEEKLHPTAKPMAVIRWAISKSESTGAVLDPFMGSGTTLAVAKDLSRKCIGIEIEEKYCEIAVKRLQQEYLSL